MVVAAVEEDWLTVADLVDLIMFKSDHESQ